MNDKDSLERLLLDIEILEGVKKYTDEVNIFEVLKISNAELKHSIMLAYLLTPSQSHGLGVKPLEMFFRQLSINSKIDKINLFNLLDINYWDFDIIREYKNIDILIKSDENKIVLCIENKVKTGEHDNQLNRYKKIIEEEYRGYKKIFLYLTPNGEESSDTENWINVSYEEILDIIDTLEIEKINDRVRILIEDYKELIRRKIVNDDELKEICNKIYKKHRRAFDLIWENKEDETYYVRNIIENYLVELNEQVIIKYDKTNSNKTYLRFTTEDLEKKFPLLEENNSSWKNKNTVFYEIIIGRQKVRAQISFGYKGVDQVIHFENAKKYVEKLGFDITKAKIAGGYFVKIFKETLNIEKIELDEEVDRMFIRQELDKIIEQVLNKNNNEIF